MQVAINCLQIEPSYTGGVNTYTMGLLEGFAAAGNHCRFRLFVTRSNQHLFQGFRNRDRFEVVVTGDRVFSLRRNVCRAVLLSCSRKLYRHASNLAFRSIREMMDGESDVIYTPTVVLQCFNSRKPTVLSMHDIQHVHYPEFFNWPRRLSRRITYGLSARYANFFQASSQFIKDDLLAYFPEISPRQIEVIPEGVNLRQFSVWRDTSFLSARYGLPEKFLIYPAQLWPHKNHLTVLKALKQIETRHGLKVPLVLTGAKFSAAPKIFEFIADQSMDYVRYLGKVPVQDLVALYQKAAFVISAGFYESNSLPVLEAAAAGTPIIAAKIPPNEECARVLQLNLFDPLDPGELARLIYAQWNDKKAASVQAAYNREHIAFYSWENAARKYMRLFERIVNS